jgi:hypothetical protein
MYITDDDIPYILLEFRVGDGDGLSSRTVFLLSRMSPFIRRCAGADFTVTPKDTPSPKEGLQ